VVGNSDTSKDANLKLVQVWGKLQNNAPLEDETFGLEISNALRLSRKVEMYQYCKKTKEEDFNGSDSEEKEDQVVDSVYSLKFSHAPVSNDDVLRQNPKGFPINSKHRIARKAFLHNFELDQEQCAKLGKFQTLRITDELRDMMIERIRNRKEFRDYKQFFRHKNFLVCRLEPVDDYERDFGVYKEKKSMKYQHGDLRILFEVVPCAKVSLCGQQIQRPD